MIHDTVVIRFLYNGVLIEHAGIPMILNSLGYSTENPHDGKRYRIEVREEIVNQPKQPTTDDERGEDQEAIEAQRGLRR